MTIPAYPFPNDLSQQSRRQPPRANMIMAQFGDGYSMRAQDGINAIPDGWTIVHDNFLQADRDTFWAFFYAQGNWNKFSLQMPGDAVSKNWIFKDTPQETPMAGDLYSIQVTAEQVFDPA